MNAESRRQAILKKLGNADGPVSASKMAAEMSVSRQIIVGDIALLRAAGSDIMATPRGYIMTSEKHDHPYTRKIACIHTAEETQKELYAIVDEGCTVEDVIIEHPIYGEIRGWLRISSRHDVDEFIKASMESGAAPLSALTDGIHLHTLSCPDEESFTRVKESLREIGMLHE